MFISNQSISQLKNHLKSGVTNLLLFGEKTDIEIKEIIDEANTSLFYYHRGA